MNYIVKKIYRYMQKNMQDKRVVHSIGVAFYADYLCGRFGINDLRCFIAGLSHDIARDLGTNELLELSAKYKEHYKESEGCISELEKNRPVLLHGKAGAFLLKRDLGIEDQTILEAVAWHVTGKRGMSLIAKCVFIADYFEPGRDFVSDEERKKIVRHDVNPLVIYVLEQTFKYLKKSGNIIARDALELYKELKRVES